MLKPIKKYCLQEATYFMRNHPNASLQTSFWKTFSAAWNKGARVGNGVKGFVHKYVSF